MDDSDLASRDDLNVELNRLLRSAHENGVDVEGGYDCRNDGGLPDWDVVVAKVAEPDSPE